MHHRFLNRNIAKHHHRLHHRRIRGRSRLHRTLHKMFVEDTT